MKRTFKHIGFIIFLCNTYAASFSQDSLLIHYLVERITQQQVKEDNFFMKGIFPSYISNTENFSEHKKDNNIFFNGLISFTLKNIQDKLPEQDQLTVDGILKNEQPLFAQFKNRNGRSTYNFWRTDSAFVFPYTKWIHLIKKSTDLPDDMDDTVFSLFALNTNDSAAEELHQLMQHYVNSDTDVVRVSNNLYKNIPAYSVWFGKNFPVVFDACVMCNILSFVQVHHLAWTEADSASLDFILKTIQTKDYINYPLEVSPYYGRTSIILYHLARLMSIKPIPQLEAIKTNLIAEAVNEFSNTDNVLEKIILSSAILKWGYNPLPVSIPKENKIEELVEKNDMPFFIGNIPSYLPIAQKNILLKNDLGLFYHYCPAFNDVLLLEYLVLKDE